MEEIYRWFKSENGKMGHLRKCNFKNLYANESVNKKQYFMKNQNVFHLKKI